MSRKPVTQECRANPYLSKWHVDYSGCCRDGADARRWAVRFRRRMKRPMGPPRTEEEMAAPNARIAA